MSFKDSFIDLDQTTSFLYYITKKYHSDVEKWASKVSAIGCTPLGTFRCRVYADNGVYLWEYPSQKIERITF